MIQPTPRPSSPAPSSASRSNLRPDTSSLPSRRSALGSALRLAAGGLVAPAALSALGTGLTGCTGNDMKKAAEEPRVLVNPPAFVLQWSTDLELPNAKKDPVVSLFVREDRLFAYTRSGRSYVLTRASGALEHMDEVPGGGDKLHPPVLLAERIVYPTIAALEVFDTKGIYLRSIPADGSIRSDAVGDGRSSVFVSVDQPGVSRVSKFNLAQLAAQPAPTLGKRYPIVAAGPQWSLQSYHKGIPAAPAWYADVVYVGGEDGLVVAVSSDERSPIWGIEHEGTPTHSMFDARSAILANLNADESGLFVPTVAGVMYCIDRINGTVKWQYFAKTPPLDKPIILTSDTVYIEDPGRGIVAVDKVAPAPVAGKPGKPMYSRDPRWASTTITQILAQDDHYTLARRQDGSIVAMDKQTGESNFATRHKDFSVYATNPKDGTVYVGTKDGRVLSIKVVTTPGVTGQLV